MKPFLTNKGAFSDSNITIENKNGDIVNNDETLANLFNEYYINIVESSSGIKPKSVMKDSSNSQNDELAITNIIEK